MRGLLALTLLLAGLATSAHAAPAPRSTRPAFDSALDALLAKHVKRGVVDYPGLCGADHPRLVACLEALASVDTDALAPRERTAFGIDLYNATVLGAVCERGRAGWSAAADSFALFHAPLVRTHGRTLSLDQLEHGLLVPGAKDPRLHFALVCAARSCPVLLPRAYRAADLDSLLDANLRAFLADPARNRFDAATRTAHLSRIFDWYAADFGGPGGVLAYVTKASGRDLTGWTVKFLDYDWSLNGPGPR